MRISGSRVVQTALVILLALISSQDAHPQARGVPARITQAVDLQKLVTLRGNTHPLARPAFDRGAAPDNLPAPRMLLVLQRSPEQETALRKLLDEQQIKSSPNYHQWLTPEEFGRQFGPADEDIQAVTDWLTGQGFQVNRVAAGRTVIEFSGTAGLVRQALHTELHKYVVSGEEHWANARDPQIPAALAAVVAGVASLNNFPRKPQHHEWGTFTRSKATGEVTPLFTFPISGVPQFAVGPTDFATIYNVLPLWTAGIDGTGQIIAISAQTNINIQDVRDFRSMFGLPANDPQIILNGPDPGIVISDEGEADLDVQWAGALAKNATVDLVVSESTETTAGIDLSALYIVDNNLASVMSESYGSCEAFLTVAGNDFYSTLWEQAAAQGITVLVAAGDSGSAGCDGLSGQTAASNGLAVSGLASTPFNVAVGGTDFDDATTQSTYWNTTNTSTTQSSAKSYIPEKTWNDTCAASGSTSGCGTVASDGSDLAAGGGGASSCALSSICGASAGYPKPAWQSGTGVPNDSVRDLPDVSLFSGLATSFYIFCEVDANTGTSTSCNLNSPYTNFQGAGGTSFASPAFAGIMALVNQKTGVRQGNANYVLYKLAAQSGASCASNATMAPNASGSSCIFYDTIKGNISVACTGGSPNCSKTTSGGFGILVVNPSSASPTPAYPTTAGYDLATGLGTVNATNLVNKWSSVSFASTSTSLTLSPTNLVHGQLANVTIGVTSTSGTPTGAVSLIGSTNPQAGITAFTLTSGGVTSTTNMLPGGAYNVTAHYAGDGTFGASDSGPTAVTVSPEPSATNIVMVTFDQLGNAIPSTTAAYGSPYVLRSDVTNASLNTCYSHSTGLLLYPCPTGTVTVTDNGQPIPEQGAPPGYTAGSYKLNSSGYLEDIYVQLPAGANNIVASYGGDASYNPSTTSNAITITAATTTTSLTASPSTASANTQVTLTAVVGTQSSGVAPTGTVKFTNSGTAIAGSPVNCTGTAGSFSAAATCQASLTTTFTSNAQVTAQYSGDTNYVGSTSAPATVTVPPDFTLTADPKSVTGVSPGLSATSKITLAATNGFTGSVAFTCAVPLSMTAAACNMNPTSLTTSGTTTLTVTTAAPTSAPPPFTPPNWFVGPAVLTGLLLLLLVVARKRRLALAFGLLALLLMSAGLVACGGGGGGVVHNPGTPAGTYAITVTGTSGTLSHTATVSVTVQ